MLTFASITEARRGLRIFVSSAGGSLPANTLDRLEALVDSPSPVDQIARSAELLYASRAELNDDARAMCGALAAFAAVNGWQGMATDNRGGLIAQAMERDLGFKATKTRPAPQPADSDPLPLQRYAPVEPA